MDTNPIDTGKLSKAGRKIWFDPVSKEYYSEKTVTIPVTRNEDGSPAPGTKWVNVPTVFDGGKVLDDEDFLSKFYQENKYKDPLTNKKLDIFDSAQKAVDAASKRSSSLID